MSSPIPFEDFGGNGEVIHFAHANGFPARSYQQFINELLPAFRVIGMNARPLWDNSKHENFKSWETATDDLIRFLDAQGLKDIIGIGHSFGATCTLLAAQKRPDLFSRLVLIEPVVLPQWFYILVKFLPQFFLKRWNPIVKKTLARKDQWTDRVAAFKHFRRSKLFALVSDEILWDYVNSIAFKNELGVSLNYSKEWEAKIFLTVSDPWKALKQLKHPTLIIRGETSDTIFPNVWRSMKSTITDAKLIEIAGAGHLVPVEKPQETTRNIQAFLNSDL